MSLLLFDIGPPGGSIGIAAIVAGFLVLACDRLHYFSRPAKVGPDRIPAGYRRRDTDHRVDRRDDVLYARFRNRTSGAARSAEHALMFMSV
jgi:hypothetical protein